jgi:hypothetical protein
MPSISLLKEQFDALPIDSTNIDLYAALLRSDISDYKPLMQQILAGTLDIEDTRKLLPNDAQYNRFGDKNTDARIGLTDEQLAQNMKDNLSARLFGGEVIKENVMFRPDISSMQTLIAENFTKLTGQTLTQDQINSILPIMNEEVIQELNVANLSMDDVKQVQLVFSDLLSTKPISSY